jgi:hypothetical protein
VSPVGQHDPAWDTASPAFCPFVPGDCPASPPCPSNDKRVCVNGEDE